MSQLPPTTPPQGWYPDPAGSGGMRWWSGFGWGEGVMPPPQQYMQVDLGRELDDAKARASWAPYVVAAYPALATVMFIIFCNTIPPLVHQFVHYINQVTTSQNNGSFSSVAPSLPTFPYVLEFPPYLSSALEIAMLVWIVMVGTSGKRMGYPLRWQPYWGALGFFIPILNFFVPYLVVRDSVSPSNLTTRRLVFWWWLSFFCVSFLMFGLAALGFLGTSWAVFSSVVIFALGCGWTFLAYRMAQAVSLDQIGMLENILATHQVSHPFLQ